jgi:hypothetical protein
MSEFVDGQVILPNDKSKFIEKISAELSQLRKDMAEKKITGASIEIAKRNEKELQSLIDKFLQKKGVITPQETSETLLKLDELKKLRLQRDFNVGWNIFTFNTLAILAGIGLIWFILKNQKDE